VKSISHDEAIRKLAHPVAIIRLRDIGDCPGFPAEEPLCLIAVPGGSNGTEVQVGDWIVLHPDGYPTVVTHEVAWGKIHAR
jgi:hypothetical protein